MAHNNGSTNNHSSNGSSPSSNNGTQPQPMSQSGQSAFDEVGQIQQQADLMIAGLHQAGLANSAAAIQRHADRLQTQTADLERTFTVLLDPDLPVALAELRAGRTISDRLGKRQPLPYTPLPKVEIELPGIPDFGRFYSAESSQPAQPQVALPSSSGSTDSPIDAEPNETTSNGKQPTAAGKGFGTQRKDS
jgi:hypothetical protein